MKAESGFTLVEVIIAILLMFILALGMSTMVLLSRQMRFNAEVKTAATQYAEGIIESYRNRNFADIALTSSPSFTSAADLDNLEKSESNETFKGLNFEYKVEVTGYDVGSITSTSTFNSILTADSADPEVKKVTVTVKWGNSNAEKVVLEALLK